MIKKIEANNRYHAQDGWLSSYHLFSFAKYHDPENMNFGLLRVFNDDTIAGNSGFGKHGHRDMEIITIVRKGELTHEDTLGNRKTIRAGEVQYMSAGLGVMHSEMNLMNDPVHLYQIWIQPIRAGLVPRYVQKDFSKREKNKMIVVASGVEQDGAILIRTAAAVSLCLLEKGKQIQFMLISKRKIFLYIAEGAITINGVIFAAGDQARIEYEPNVLITAVMDSDFVMIGTEVV